MKYLNGAVKYLNEAVKYLNEVVKYHLNEVVTYLNEVVKEASVESLGERITGLCRLFTVESDFNILSLSTPLTVHRTTGQLDL